METRRCVVVGGGVMGLWSALSLREAGHEVLLVDAWGVGHPRATSSGENRVIRCGYGGSRLYARWARRSLDLWASRQRGWGEGVLHRCGVLWLVVGEEDYARRSLEDVREVAVPHERLEPGDLRRRWPQVRASGIRWALLEPASGLLLARRACRALARDLARQGVALRRAQAGPPEAGRVSGRRLESLHLTPGPPAAADLFLFACGPWLPGLFPSLLGRRIRVTRKDVFYFGTPPGVDDFDAARMPVWMELGRGCYGLPAVADLGFKVHPDRPGPRFDPTGDDRRPSPRLLGEARRCLARRFPRLRDAPLVEARVCQYESTGDDHMILDRHPDLDNVWIVGGGSGHCFKHGPAIGQLAAEAMSGAGPDSVPPELRLSHVASGRNF